MVMRVLVVVMLLAGGAQPTRAQTSGVVRKSADACPGYTLIAPFGGHTTYLIDLDGRPVHRWESYTEPAHAAYLLNDGSLLRTSKVRNEVFNVIGGPAGGVQRYDWEGNLTWDFVYSNADHMSHHDIEPLPNGNVLIVAWELKTREQAIAAGRNPGLLVDDVLWPETVIEVEPVGQTEGKIVWEWHLWDHVVQDFDPHKSNYGDPTEHPELVDLNYCDPPDRDWIHMNSIDYDPELDQIMLCGRTFDEVWVIDHGTTTAEAAGHSGGRAGRGGDLLYRWGNPYAYFAGLPDDQQLFGQHNLQWIPPDAPVPVMFSYSTTAACTRTGHFRAWMNLPLRWLITRGRTRARQGIPMVPKRSCGDMPSLTSSFHHASPVRGDFPTAIL